MGDYFKKYGIFIIGAFILVAAFLRHIITLDTGLILLAIVPSVILHEVSHGYVALLFGDTTAKRSGRLTLNPIAHIDPLGSIILPAILILSGVSPIGYAKPVPVNVSALRKPRNQAVWVSLAGPFTNLVIASIVGLILRERLLHELSVATFLGASTSATYGGGALDQYLFYLGIINVMLAIFNLIPIPPLDGSAVLERFIPSRHLASYYGLRRYFLPIVIVVFIFLPALMQKLFSPFVNVWLRVFIPS